jgi:hypothetical protein
VALLNAVPFRHVSSVPRTLWRQWMRQRAGGSEVAQRGGGRGSEEGEVRRWRADEVRSPRPKPKGRQREKSSRRAVEETSDK